MKDICTKEEGTDFCNIPSPYGKGRKWPTFAELHRKLNFGKLENAHCALADVEAMGRCCSEMVKNRIIAV